MAKKPIKNSKEKIKKIRLKNLKKGMWKKGQSGNPLGKPVGQRSYITIYREALAGLAKKKNCTPEELENIIEQVGIAKAMSGDYRFFKDFRDRVHGEAIKTNVLTGAGGKDLIPDPESKKASDDLINQFLPKIK
jgi:hypothetical protein